MHIITGLLLSYLFGKKNKSHNPLLTLTWPIKTKHLLPGRVRFQIPLMRGKESELEMACRQISKIEGIISIEHNSIIGSILIYFNEKMIQADLIYAAFIRVLNLEKELEETPPSALGKEIKTISHSLNQVVYGKSNGFIDLRTSIPLILGIIGISQIVAKKTPLFPTGVTLLWWAYNALMQNNRG
jgi:hypothetical protein